MSDYLITKQVHQFTYYLSKVEFDGKKYHFKWNGIQNNALKLNKDYTDEYLKELRYRFPSSKFNYLII